MKVKPSYFPPSYSIIKWDNREPLTDDTPSLPTLIPPSDLNPRELDNGLFATYWVRGFRGR